MAKPRNHKAGDGLQGAAAALGRTVHSPEVEEILSDFKRLNTDEARGWFADHFLSRSAGAIDRMWPVFYRMLKAMEERGLYANADYTTNRQAYGSFREYFEDRVGRPFDTWLELERTYHYVHAYRPELLAESFADAKAAAAARGELGDRRTAVIKALDEAPLPPIGTNQHGGSDNIIPSGGQGTSESYLRRRLKRDHPDLYERVAREEASAYAAAIEAGVVKRTVSVRVDDAASAARTLRKYLNPDQIRELARLLLDEEQADV